MTETSRRRLFEHLGRCAAALALASLFGPSHGRRAGPVELPSNTDYPFTLGVASGMPRPDSVVLWTRLAPRPHEPLGGLPPRAIPLRWELADDALFSRGLRSGVLAVLPEHAHSAHVAVDGLPAGATFYYRFMTGDAVSPIGRTRTAPALDADVGRLRIALASCQHYEQGAYVAHREIAERDLDLVLFVGDYIYESSSPRFQLRAHEGPEPTTLDAYRARHATYKLDPDLRAAHAAHPWLLTWDDHEVQNDYANDLGKNGGSPQAFLRRRAAAYKAYFEHLPVSPGLAPTGPDMRIHERHAWGRLADLWTLDNRQYRSVQACNEPRRAHGRIMAVASCDELGDARRSMFGMAQEAWLAQGLTGNPRRWKLLAQGTQICPGGVDMPFGRRIHADGWDGYPEARQRLLQTIAQAGLRDVLCLGGDVHRHVAADLRVQPNDVRSPIVASEFVCSSVTSRGLSEAATALMRSSNPDLRHARSDERGYALLDITREGTTCEFRATPFPARSDARLRTQASFRVAGGVAGVGPA